MVKLMITPKPKKHPCSTGATVDKGGTGDVISFIRFRSGTRSLPIVQAAERQFQLVLGAPAG
jgi:hypothetical protein